MEVSVTAVNKGLKTKCFCTAYLLRLSATPYVCMGEESKEYVCPTPFLFSV